jgi:hypothetical protein
MRGSVMISQDFADALFDRIVDEFPLARRESSNALRIGFVLLDRRVSDRNVNLAITPYIPVEVFQRYGAQTIDAKILDYDTERVEINDAVKDIVPWIRAHGGDRDVA